MPSTEDHGGYVGMAFFSDDQGYSWQASKNTVDMQPIEVQEADAVELKDGRVMMFARTYSGHPARAYSSDKGETWSKGELIQELAMPNATDSHACGGFPRPATCCSSGAARHRPTRTIGTPPPLRLTTAISKDEGKTFIHQRNIARDPDDDFGYQCIEFVGNDLALIGYHCRDGLRVARIGIDWFYEK